MQNSDFSQDTSTASSTQRNDVSTLAVGTIVSVIGKAGGGGLQALVQIVTARLLGPELFGLYAIGWTVLRIISRIASLGLDKGVLHFAPKYLGGEKSKFKGLIFEATSIALVSGLLLGSLGFVLAPWLANQVFHKPELQPVFQWLSFAMPFATVLYVGEATTRISKKMKYSIFAEQLSQPLSGLIIFIILYMLGVKFIGALASVVFSFLTASLLVIFYIGKLYPDIYQEKLNTGDHLFKKLMAYSIPASVAGIFSMLVGWIDRLLVGYFLSASDTGIYQVVSQSSIFFTTLLSAFSAIFAPMIADLYHKNETHRLFEVFKISTKWGLYICMPLFLIIFFVPKEFVITIFGQEYASGWLPLVILTIGQFINVATGSVGLLLIMTGKQAQWSIFSGISLGLNFILNWVLTPRFGLMGASVGTAIAISSMFLSGLFFVKIALGVWPYDKRYFKGVAATGITSLCLFVLGQFNTSHPLISLILTAIVSVFVFGLTLVVVGLDTEDQAFIGLIIKRIGLTNNNFR